MARDNELIITAGLDTPKTTDNISNDLKSISEKLSSQRALKVIGNIDLPKTTQRIQSQLNTINKNLSVKIGDIDFGSIQNTVDKQLNVPTFKAKITPEIDKRSIKQQANELEKILDLKLPRRNTKNIRKEIQSLLNDYKNAFQSNNFEEMQGAFNRLDDYIRPFRKEIEIINDDLTETQKKIKELARSEKLYISQKEYDELAYTTGSKANASSLLSKVFGVGNWTKDISKGKTTWDAKVQELNDVFQIGRNDQLNEIDSGRFADHIEGISQLLKYLNTDFNENTEYIKHYGQEIDDVWGDTLYNSINKVLGLVSSSDGDFIEILGTDSIEDINKVKSSMKEIENSYENLSNIKKQFQDTYGVSDKDVSAHWIKDANGDLSMNATEIKRFIDKLKDLNVYGVNISELQKRFENLNVAIESITPTFTTLEEGGEKVLSSLAVKGKDSLGNLVNYVESYNAKNGEFVKSTTKVTENLNKIEKAQIKIQKETDNTQRAYNEFLKLQGKFDVYSKQYEGNEELASQFQKISGLITEFNDTEPLDKQRESLIKIDNALKLVEVDIKKIKSASTKTKGGINDFYPNIAKTGSTSDILENAKTSLNEMFAESTDTVEDKASRVKRAIEDTSGELQRFYVQVERGDKSVETLTYALNEQGNAYEYLGKTIREADNSTDFRRKGLDVQKKIQSENLIKFAAQIEKSGVATDALKSKIVQLQGQINKIDDTSSMNAFLDDLDVAKAQFQALNSMAKSKSFAESLNNKIKKLAANMSAYSKTNQKAVNSTKLMSDGVTTFAEKWDELTSRMKSGNLNADEFKHLNEEVTIFKNEVKAAGLDSGAFFHKIGDQVRLIIAQWISLNAVISKTKEMISNVINIDKAMVNLKKVTNETDDTYEKFLNKTDVRAKKLHTTISSLTTQTSEWAKLGFDLDEASELAETSMIYSKVGEVDDQTAVSDLVATMKAFNIEAENSMSIVDALNKLGNKFATDSAALGDGLSVSASTLSVAGNDLSQSLALLTGGTEITQDANAMGNALRVISLRVRGMKGELEELNEETEGLESISKIQTQILNLTGNRVNIFDSNNNFRSTYDILKDISEVYDKLNDPDRADLTEILFGKNRANQGIAILQAFQSGQIEKAYEAAQNSTGSAMAEFEEVSKGIESHINDFRKSWEELSNDFIDSDFLKTVIDSGAKLIDILDTIIDRFGAFPTIIGVIAGGLSFKGVGKPKTEYA